MSLTPRINVLTAALLAGALLAGTVAAQQIENAFVIIIDGLRDDEGFESGARYLRHIWYDLRPLGTINTRFWDRGWTATTGGHVTILSGARQILPNNGAYSQDIRAPDPLMFEYYRQHRSAPEAECGVAVGKWANCGAIADFGLEPAYGERYRGFQLRVPGCRSDTTTSRLVHLAMDSLRPRLMLVNLRDVDSYGHAGVYEDYLQAVRVADSVIYDIYRRIQALPPYTDTFYRNRTLLIVTADHGRNDDAHGGFRGHGQWDHGCRDILFYAFGPGIARGRVVDRPRDQIDIVPTIGAVLGIPMPFAEGEVMNELFEPDRVPAPPWNPRMAVPTNNISRNVGFSRDPDVCRDRYGNLHLVWSDNTPGRWSVLYARSFDDGVTWTEPRTMFDYPDDDSVMWFARVAADDSVAIAATGWGKHACPVDSVDPARLDTTFLWYPWIAASTDHGERWETTSLFDSSMGSYYPAVAVWQGRYSVAWWTCGKFGWETVRTGTNFNRRAPGVDWDSLPVNVSGRRATCLSLSTDGGRFCVGAGVLKDASWDVGCYLSEDGVTWDETWATSDPHEAPVYDLDPAMAVDDSGTIHLIWARKPNVGGHWRLMYGRRCPVAGRWDTLRLTDGSSDAWQPHVTRKGDTLALVWVGYQDGAPEVYFRSSPDRGRSWSPPWRVTFTGMLTHRPRICPVARGFFAVWQEYDGAQWDIQGEHLWLATGAGQVVRVGRPVGPTLVRGVLRLPAGVDAALLDATGRRVMELPGTLAGGASGAVRHHDVRRLSPGVYFVRPTQSGEGTVKVVITR